jgi:KDO2-lipid IV(A) lauroyltransferase
MAKKERSRAFDYCVYLALRIVACVLQALSFEAACRAARLLAWATHKIDKRHRQVAAENLQKAFPGKYSDAQIEAIVFGIYEHIWTMAVEIAHMPRRYHLHNY